MSRRRPSRWDRPPGPKDVRWFLRLVGKVLICTGLLMFGFVAYQLWGTGIEYARAQDRLENEFDDLLVELSTTSPTSATSEPGSTPGTLPNGATTVPGPVVESTTTSAPSTLPDGTESTIPDYADVIERMNITEGSAIGFLGIPRLELGVYIVPGVTRDDLQQGVGHFPQTPMPGQLGNSAVAGHRTTYGQPFRDLDQLEVGDEIVVTMPYGEFTYRVTGREIVAPSQTEVIATTDPTMATLTLTTCHPAFSARERLIIYAELDTTKSPPPGQALLNYGRDVPPSGDAGLPGEPLPGESTSPDVTPATGDAVAPTSIAAGAPASATTTDPLYSVSPGNPGGVVGGLVTPVAADGEAFSNRWFTDDEAFSQVTLWAGACAAIAAAAYLLAKRFRSILFGLAAGVVPFVVGLYFFYENVNRLLPAAL